MAITQEQLDIWEAQHGRIALVRGALDPKTQEPEWEVVFRKPTRAEFTMFKKNGLNAATSFQAQEILATQIVVSHEKAAFSKLLDEFPGIPEGCDPAIKRLTGLARDETAK
jgi:hypothetical protein